MSRQPRDGRWMTVYDLARLRAVDHSTALVLMKRIAAAHPQDVKLVPRPPGMRKGRPVWRARTATVAAFLKGMEDRLRIDALERRVSLLERALDALADNSAPPAPNRDDDDDCGRPFERPART